jgi:UDPglucose 6-dehydrogenase
MKEILLTYGINPRVAYNQEFLRQKHAFADTMSPSRIVVGSDCGKDAEDVIDLYEGTESPKFVFESFEEAELVKYYANCYYAARISFFNQMKQYADHFGADHDAIVKTIVADQSVGNHGSNPTGIPYGNACLPKDLNAIIKMGERLGIYNKMLRSVKDVNDLMINKELYANNNLKRWL